MSWSLIFSFVCIFIRQGGTESGEVRRNYLASVAFYFYFLETNGTVVVTDGKPTNEPANRLTFAFFLCVVLHILQEVALCFNQIFGRDIDSISWDYGMTDGHEHYKMAMYSMRAARLALLEDSVTQPGVVRHVSCGFVFLSLCIYCTSLQILCWLVGRLCRLPCYVWHESSC